MKRSRLALDAAPFLALTVAACGTASSTQPPKTAATPTASATARFGAAADRICAVQNHREAALGSGLPEDADRTRRGLPGLGLRRGTPAPASAYASGPRNDQEASTWCFRLRATG